MESVLSSLFRFPVFFKDSLDQFFYFWKPDPPSTDSKTFPKVWRAALKLKEFCQAAIQIQFFLVDSGALSLPIMLIFWRTTLPWTVASASFILQLARWDLAFPLVFVYRFKPPPRSIAASS